MLMENTLNKYITLNHIYKGLHKPCISQKIISTVLCEIVKIFFKLIMLLVFHYIVFWLNLSSLYFIKIYLIQKYNILKPL